MQNLTKEREQPPVVTLEKLIFSKIEKLTIYLLRACD